MTSKSSTFPPLIITDVFTVRRGWEVVAAFCVPLLQAVVIWITVAFQHGKCISFHTTAARSLDVFLSLCEPSSGQARSVHVCVSRSDCHQYISVGEKDQTPLFISAQTYLGYYFEKLIGPGLMHLALSCDSLLHGLVIVASSRMCVANLSSVLLLHPFLNMNFTSVGFSTTWEEKTETDYDVSRSASATILQPPLVRSSV